MDITLTADRAIVESTGSKYVSIDIEGVDKDDLLNELTIQDCLSYFGNDKFLNEIGEDECKEHFGLIEDNS